MTTENPSQTRRALALVGQLRLVQRRDDEFGRLARQRPLTDDEKAKWTQVFLDELELESELESLGAHRYS